MLAHARVRSVHAASWQHKSSTAIDAMTLAELSRMIITHHHVTPVFVATLRHIKNHNATLELAVCPAYPRSGHALFIPYEAGWAVLAAEDSRRYMCPYSAAPLYATHLVDT